MRSRLVDVVLSCFLTSAIGGILTLAAALQFGWGLTVVPIGVALSAIAAYFLHNPHEVGAGIVRAWHHTATLHMRIDWKKVDLAINTFIPLSGMMAVLIVDILLLLEAAHAHYGLGEVLPRMSLFILTMSSCFGLFVACGMMCSIRQEDIVKFRREVPALYRGVLYVLPTSVVVLFFIGAWKMLGLLREEWPMIREWAGEFLWKAFVYIHSEERRIRMTSTLIGTSIGCAWGYSHQAVLVGALLCGIVGAAAGALEYQLVSVRLLKIVPKAH